MGKEGRKGQQLGHTSDLVSVRTVWEVEGGIASVPVEGGSGITSGWAAAAADDGDRTGVMHVPSNAVAGPDRTLYFWAAGQPPLVPTCMHQQPVAAREKATECLRLDNG